MDEGTQVNAKLLCDSSLLRVLEGVFDGVLSLPAGVIHFYHQRKLNKVQTEVPEDKQGGLDPSGTMFGRKLTVNVTAIPELYCCNCIYV